MFDAFEQDRFLIAFRSMRPQSFTRMAPSVAAVMAASVLAGCEPYRVEYHEVPAFYYQASATEIPERVVLDDGTVIVYQPKNPDEPRLSRPGPARRPLELRREADDGTVTLRAVLPEHVLSHTIQCLHDEAYRLYYDQMLSDQAKMHWDDDEQGFTEFEQFMRRNRRELLRTLNRMFSGLKTQDVAVEPGGQGAMRIRLRPQMARGFHFTQVQMVSERGELRLLTIR